MSRGQRSAPAPLAIAHPTPSAADDNDSSSPVATRSEVRKLEEEVARAAISPRLEPAGADHVLGQTTERIIRPHDDEEPSSEVEHGLYIVRGDNVTVVGLVDEELDESINWNEVRGAVIGGVKHSA
ncbi:hypothetical protein VE04_07235 [Pseudogymnoascus sp. 24MN13]|nr:hypothetical protein VE04_07235 [Pseudogymnoascus sp. 24MN13]